MKKKTDKTVEKVNTYTHTHGELFNKIKEQKGSITLFVLVACMFMIIVLLLVNIGITNKNASQEKELAQITKRYSVNETDLANDYAKVADENEYITVKQVQEMIATESNNLSSLIGLGGIEESGSDYIRFKDGTQIVWGQATLLANTTSVRRTVTVNLPKEFIQNNYRISITPELNGNIIEEGIWVGDIGGNKATTQSTFVISGGLRTSEYDANVDYIAIGKWK